MSLSFIKNPSHKSKTQKNLALKRLASKPAIKPTELRALQIGTMKLVFTIKNEQPIYCFFEESLALK